MKTFSRIKEWMDSLGLRQVRRVIVFVTGFTVVLFGVALLVLPGPATLVIPAGLAILGLEFEWARRWLKRAREALNRGLEGAQSVFSSGPRTSARDPEPRD